MVRRETPEERARRRKEDAKAPKDYDTSKFERFSVTCDIVIMTVRGKDPHVLLVKRAKAPYAGYWALPGGFKDPNETLDQAAKRELKEETNFSADYLEQFRSYGDPGRDSRTNVVTVAYVAVVPEIGNVVGGTDAAEAAVHSVADIRSGSLDLAFDHQQIVLDAFGHVANELERRDIATKFLLEEFTLTQLRSVYEGFWGDELDGANFRRNLLSEPLAYVKPTGKLGFSTASGGRPPELFRATKAWRDLGSPIRRKRRTGKNQP